MELSVSKADLLRELQFFQGIVERKNTIPILANVLIDAKGSEVRLAATDLEVGLKSRCPAKIEKPGSLTLPAKKLFEIIKALPDTDVLIQEDKNGVKVAADRFESRLQTMSRDDFPAMPDGGGAGDAVLPREITRQMVAKTQFAITGEDTRYFLNGALLVLRPNDMSMVATDGHRLALVTAPRESAPGAPDELRVIVQKKTLLELGPSARRSRRRGHVREGREPPVLPLRRARARVADDRRPVSGLRTRHPEGQRQGGRVRSRSADECGQARRPARQRTVALGEVPDRCRAK